MELTEQINNLPVAPGVYIFKNKDHQIIYIGKSVRLRERVKSYFALDSDALGPKTNFLVSEIAELDYVETASELEALVLEAVLIKKHKPKYNTQWKDDKAYQYIKIQNAAYRRRNGIKRTVKQQRWPYVTTARQQKDKDALYFGPFPEGRTIKKMLRVLRRLFPWCKYKSAAQAKRAGRACFYAHIELCPGICRQPNAEMLHAYWKNIDRLVLFLEGKKQKVIHDYEKMMKQAAREKKYEQAAKFRDVVENMTYITQQFRDAQEYIENPNLIQDQRRAEVEALVKLIPSADTSVLWEDLRVEGYDISNLGQENTVASRVVSVGGEMVKSAYRRYKIKEEKLPDDYAAIYEVIKRRLRKKDDLPHLILIDGGKGQLMSALHAMDKVECVLPVFSLAKREETIIMPNTDEELNGFSEINLPADSPALHLVQRIRDEAHRFAQSYHKYLRRKKSK